MVRAISFDFHDTIAIAPSWFQLEVRQLVSATHATLVAEGHLNDGPSAEALDASYRQLRLEIHQHGQEHDALACVTEVLRRHAIACPLQPTAQIIERLMRGALADVRPRAGVIETIQRLSQAGLPIGITSSAVYHPFLLWTLETFGLTAYLRSIITSASCGFYKSRPEIYHCTASALGVAPSDLLHIGDSFRWDVAAPSRLGITTVWLNLKAEPSPEPGLAALTIDSYAGLADQLLRLIGHP
jgi:FMN phosphatase YigB (HAD superfamily)